MAPWKYLFASLLDCYPNVLLHMRTNDRLDIALSSFFGFLNVAVSNDANIQEINFTKPKTNYLVVKQPFYSHKLNLN